MSDDKKDPTGRVCAEKVVVQRIDPNQQISMENTTTKHFYIITPQFNVLRIGSGGITSLGGMHYMSVNPW